ncbi:hypothetical protein [Shewanella gaetbuli]|uniref:Uncharacterized protein n=1 Tax=Shewanella gaetbuli TaxID=220752 RepID=A0A9X1ZIJ0_9GAMM|nr:hypothetical protein [Shewanella gaetbuli]MCL1142989.1 hypothetical protein [Shewanella gaetbuli]
MAIPLTNFSSADVIKEARGSIQPFNSNDADVRNLAGYPSGMYNSGDWAGVSSTTHTLIPYYFDPIGQYPYKGVGYFRQNGGQLSPPTLGGMVVDACYLNADYYNRPSGFFVDVYGGYLPIGYKAYLEVQFQEFSTSWDVYVSHAIRVSNQKYFHFSEQLNGVQRINDLGSWLMGRQGKATGIKLYYVVASPSDP